MDAPAFFVHAGAMGAKLSPVAVLGGGIAGLAVARALALQGAEVTVFEQAAALGEIGAGLQISPNGVRVLEALGLGAALCQKGQRAEAVVLCDYRGGPVATLPLRGQQYYFLHRADLVDLLAEGARAAGVRMALAQQARGLTLAPGGATFTTTQGGTHEARLLIGADGLHSVVRAALNGRVVPFFTRQVAWRALVPGDGAARGQASAVVRVWMGPGRHLVSYPLRGGTLINLVAVEERGRWTDEGWQHEDDPEALRAAFAGFTPEVRSLLERVEKVHLWGLFRHPVARHWHGQSAAILGDAAHPTLPFLAQGANLALEDAWVLAAMLARHAGLEAGLAAYQALRAPRAARVIEAATRNGRLYHLRQPLPRMAVQSGMRAVGALAPGLMVRRLAWVHGYDATQV